MSARAPYRHVHRVRTDFLDAAALQSLAADGRGRMHVNAFSDIDYAQLAPEQLSAVVPGVPDLFGQIARALQVTGVLGDDEQAYRRSVMARTDYLASCGAGFHNDVSRHWTGCLFWNLVIVADDVEFVMPHAGVRLALQPGDLIVFDQTMAHGLCRPRDHGHAVSTSFDTGDDCRQIFLSGELALTDLQWAALGAPWLPVEQHGPQPALDLMAAAFDERSGAVQRVRSLVNCMSRDVSYVDGAHAAVD